MKIAIIAWGAMADVLYATPIVAQIRRQFPEAEVTWLVRDKFAEVVETNPDINHVVSFTLPPGHTSRQDAEYVMDQEIVKYAQGYYDRVFDLQYWPRYNNFYDNPTEDFISLRARNAGINPVDIVDRKIVLKQTEQDLDAIAKFLHKHQIDQHKQKFITANHISYAASPVWSFENYTKLIGILSDCDIRCVFTGAPNEPLPTGAIDARGMPYREWAALIAISDLWLGLDSGAVALACAGDVPIIKLYSSDFPLAKTGIKAMGLRAEDVLELCPAPNPEAMAELIMENMS